MGAGGAANNGSNDTQVSGYEREIEKQKAKEKAQKEAFEKYSKENLNPNNNTQTINKNKQNLEDAERMQRENRGGNQPTVKVAETPKVDTSPTESELSQSSATDADEYDLRKVKKRGRSMMALTGPRGLLKDDKLTLGKPSLLGS
jgi:hypothetical protein